MMRIAALAAVVACMLTLSPPAPAAAQTYGFDATCGQIGSDLDSSGIPGVTTLGGDAAAVCQAGNAASHPDDAASAVTSKAWSSTFGQLVASLSRGLGQCLVLSLTFWTKLPAFPGGDDPRPLLARVQDYTYQAQILLLLVSVIMTGLRLALARRGGVLGEVTGSVRAATRVVIASWMLGAILTAATRAGDAFSAWVLADSTGDNAANITNALVNLSALQAFSPGLVLIVTLVGLLGALAQVVLAIVRQGLLVVAAGALPLAAAASGTGIGREAYHKLTAWITAFLLWKPLAAIVYMIAFTAIGSTGKGGASASLPDADQGQRMLVALVLLCSVAFVLPMLMRLIVPGVAAAGRGGSGFAAAAGVAGVAAIATTGGTPTRRALRTTRGGMSMTRPGNARRFASQTARGQGQGARAAGRVARWAGAPAARGGRTSPPSPIVRTAAAQSQPPPRPRPRPGTPRPAVGRIDAINTGMFSPEAAAERREYLRQQRAREAAADRARRWRRPEPGQGPNDIDR